MGLQNIALNELHFGHEFPGTSINARKHDREADIEQMAASISAEGILQSLLAVGAPTGKKGFYTVDGNRRLAALRLLVKKKKISADAFVPVIVSDETDPAKALRKSLAAGEHHVALHPVDQYEAFVACQDDGDTPEKIADRYAMPLRIVKQRLALGQLSPVIRDAWRKGKLTTDAAEAYASTPHHAAQEKLFKRGNWESKQANQIRQALVGSSHAIERLLKFVGEEAYKKAGGQLREDLFGDKASGKFADFGLLERLAAERLKTAVADLVKNGWGWAAVKADLPNGADYSWPRKTNPTKEERKKLGVILDIDYNGKLEQKAGVIKPGVKGIKASDGRSAPKVKKKPAGTLSDSLAQRLSESLTFAAGNAIRLGDNEFALAIAVAALTSSNSPVDLKECGLATAKAERHTSHGGKLAFEKQLPVIMKLPLKDKLSMLAEVVGAACDFQVHSGMKDILDKETAAVVEAIPPVLLAAELQKKFEAEDYFGSVSGDLRLAAVREMAPDQETVVAKMKKGAQVSAAVTIWQKHSAWLPPQLRTSHYAGPAAKGKTKAAPAAKKAAKPRQIKKAGKK